MISPLPATRLKRNLSAASFLSTNFPAMAVLLGVRAPERRSGSRAPHPDRTNGYTPDSAVMRPSAMAATSAAWSRSFCSAYRCANVTIASSNESLFPR